MSKIDVLRLCGTFFVIVGSSLLLLAIPMTIFSCYFVNTASSIDGTVVRLLPGEEPPLFKKSAGSHPLIRFVPVGAKKVVEFSSSGLNYAVGDKVTVLYVKYPLFPGLRESFIDDPVALWFDPVQFVIFGGVFTFAGLQRRKLSA